MGRHPGSVVVGAAIVRDGRVLAAQRRRPASCAGRWELPGGGVEAGESEADALARECREELDLRVTVRERVGPEVRLPDGRVLRIHHCRAEDDPTPREHDALTWVGPDQLHDLDWLDTDRAVLPALAELLGTGGPPVRPRGPA